MPVLDRDALEASTLADLHEIANTLGIDGYRRLRKADLIDTIAAHQGAGAEDQDTGDEEETPKPARRRSRGGRSRGGKAAVDADTDADADVDVETAADAEEDDDKPAGRKRSRAVDADTDEDDDLREVGGDSDDDEAAGGRRRRSRGRGGRGRGRGGANGGADRSAGEEPAAAEERIAEGVVELLGNGSGFLRTVSGEESEDDVYISAAQVKRCELVTGDRISGPVRTPRRSERHPSLVRIDLINGRPADEVAEGTRFDDLPSAFPTERIELGDGDPTLEAINWLLPIGYGSRVVITGGARSGKSETLRRLAAALAEREGVEVTLVLAGVRPEELAEHAAGPVAPSASLSFAAGPEQRASAVEQTLEQARRVASRGGKAVVLIDTLDFLPPHVAQRAVASARNIVDGGSLTVIATASAPIGGETTVIALDATLAALRRFPALDRRASGTIRPELLVGEPGAEAIAKALADAVDGQ